MRRHLPILIAACLVVTAAAGWAGSPLPGRPASNPLGFAFEASPVPPAMPAEPAPPGVEIVLPPEPPAAPPQPPAAPPVPPAPPPEPPRPADVAGHWAEAYIQGLLLIGALEPGPDGAFQPDSFLTRAESVKLIVLARGVAAAPFTPRFGDPIPEWAQPYLGSAFAAGIVVGHEDGTFRANHHVTRAEMVIMVIRAWPQELPGPAAVTFADPLPPWAREAIQEAAGAGLVTGYPDGTFRPDRFVTRAEAAAIVSRARNQP